MFGGGTSTLSGEAAGSRTSTSPGPDPCRSRTRTSWVCASIFALLIAPEASPCLFAAPSIMRWRGLTVAAHLEIVLTLHHRNFP